MSIPTISIVSPVYNEQEGLAEFVRQIILVMDGMRWGGVGGAVTWELILVNDGSRDGSLRIARDLGQMDGRVRVVSFSRNFGHEAASTAGLRYARGEAVVLIDSDLQDPPGVIPLMIEKWRGGGEGDDAEEAGGYQIVYGIRSKREEETFLKKTTSWIFYRLLRRLAKIEIPKDTGDFRLMDRRVVDAFNALPERNRFVRGLVCWTGFRSTGVGFMRAPCFAGRTKYNYIKLIRLAMDSMTSFTTAPLKLATWLGTIIASSSILWVFVVIYQFFFWRNADGTPYRPAGFTFIYISILFLGGVQIFLIGLVGEYLARVYEEVQRRPLYIVDQLVNFDETAAIGGANGGLLE